MKLSEYEADIVKGENGEFVDAPGNKGATAAMFGKMASMLEKALWQPGYKADALALADRARKLSVKLS